MKNILYTLVLFSAVNILFGQTNDFKIGIIAGRQTHKKNAGIDGYETSIYLPGTNYFSSVYGVLKDDGVNLIRMYSPVTENRQQFKDLIELIGNHKMKAMTSFGDFAYKVDYYNPVNNRNVWDLGDAHTWDNNFGGYYLNYKTAFDEVYNVAPYKDIVWAHVMIGEYNDISPFPYINHPNMPSNRPPRWGVSIFDTNYYARTLIPIAAAEEQFIEFENFKVPGNKQKLLNSPGCHGLNISLDTGYYGNAAYAQPYLQMLNRGDAAFDAGYFPCQYNMIKDIDLTTASMFLWKFDNIDYQHKYFKDVYAEFNVAREIISDCSSRQSSITPLNPNYELVWFGVYTSIIHGVKGVVFYSLDEMYAIKQDSLKHDSLRLPYDDEARRDKLLSNDSCRFSISNFPNDYTLFLRHLLRELAYLKEQNLISSEPSSIVFSKTVHADDKGILPPCSTYLPDSITPLNSKGLYNVNDWAYMYNPNNNYPFFGKNDERFGIRYTIRTNGDKVIMILSNPTPFYIDLSTTNNTALNFENTANNIIRNSTGVNVLFSGCNSIPNYNSYDSSYKTQRDAQITLDFNEPDNFNVGLKHYIPLTIDKKLNLTFAPFDVHVIEFVQDSNFYVQGYDNGWDRIWTNNGNGNIDDWSLNDFDVKLAGDFDGDGNDELLLIQRPNIIHFDSYFNMYKFSNDTWNKLWSNNGDDAIDDWRIREFDHFFVGDFIKEVPPAPKKMELLIIQKNFDNPAGGGWAALYRFNNNSWQRVWSNNGNGYLGWWALRNEDKWVVGDFNGDGQDDLLSLQAFNATNPQWTQLHTFANSDWMNLHSNDINGFPTGLISNWVINYQNHFFAGKFNGASDKSYLLCVQGNGTFNKMIAFDTLSNSWDNVNYSNSIGFVGGASVFPFQTQDKYLIDNFDNDSKDKFFWIQKGTLAGWAFSQVLNDAMDGWDWNWIAAPNTPVNNYCLPYNCYPFIDDWPLADNGSCYTEYLPIRALGSDSKYLMAFRSFGNGNNFITNMYKKMPQQVLNNIPNKSEAYEILYTDDIINSYDIFLYPNPIYDMLHIGSNSNNENTFTLTILNSSGQKVRYETIKFTRSYSIDLKGISNGLYTITFQNDKDFFTKKIIIQK